MALDNRGQGKNSGSAIGKTGMRVMRATGGMGPMNPDGGPLNSLSGRPIGRIALISDILILPENELASFA
jgi:hypothetical protein